VGYKNDEDMKVGPLLVGFHPRRLEGGFIRGEGGTEYVCMCVSVCAVVGWIDLCW